MTAGPVVVDGMNVIGTRPDGWWRDRDGAVRRLADRLRRRQEEVTLVLDGRPLADLPAGRHEMVDVVYARRRGRDAADDRIVELVAALPKPRAARVVTSDRALRRRVEALGATVLGAGRFLEQLDRAER